jgi:hypothetical protein
MWKHLHVKYPLLLSHFKEIWIFWTYFRKKKAQMSSLIKIRPVEAQLFHMDERMDMKKLKVACHNFANYSVLFASARRTSSFKYIKYIS